MSDMEKYERLDVTPFTISYGMFHIIEDSDIQTHEHLHQLYLLLFNYPERDVFYFRENKKLTNPLLMEAHSSNSILLVESDPFYYQNPKYIRHYEHEYAVQYEWQKELVANSPMYLRFRLKLTEQKKRELEIWQKIETERESDDNPLELKPNFAGIGIDISKAIRWLRNRFKRK